MPNRIPSWLTWLGFVLLCNGLGIASGLVATEPAYYAALTKPAWAPPPWLFGPAWTTLYTLMGTATYLVWRRTTGPQRRAAMWAFAIQLALNISWTPVFFGAHQLGAALALILAVLAAVLVMMVVYFRRVPLAGAMIVPLAAWVAFASALNGAIWRLN